MIVDIFAITVQSFTHGTTYLTLKLDPHGHGVGFQHVLPFMPSDDGIDGQSSPIKDGENGSSYGPWDGYGFALLPGEEVPRGFL